MRNFKVLVMMPIAHEAKTNKNILLKLFLSDEELNSD
jgi:hypothetical protein